MFFSLQKKIAKIILALKQKVVADVFSANLLLSPNIFSLSLLPLFLLLVSSFSSPLFFLLSVWNYASPLHFRTSSHMEHRAGLDTVNITNFAVTLFFALLLFSRSVQSDCLQPHGPQHARLPCPSLSLGACSNSGLLSQ